MAEEEKVYLISTKEAADILKVTRQGICKIKEERYLESGKRIVQCLSTTQNITSPNAGIRGGIAGSHPIDGEYCANRYLSWATKFYIDAINLLLILY